jgi:hypothetical protein
MAWIAAMFSQRSFHRALSALLLLNLFDAVSTSLWVGLGVTSEANPLMVTAMELGLGPFVLGKVALVGLAVWLLWGLRARMAARVAALPAVLLYCFIGGTHLGIGLRTAGLALS